VSVTVDEELIEWVDEIVGKRAFASRSHAISEALRLLKDRFEEGR